MTTDPDPARITPDECPCYECVGPDYRYTDDGHKYIHNNLKLHTLGEPCRECGRPKTDYLDCGHKGYYICAYCHGSEPQLHIPNTERHYTTRLALAHLEHDLLTDTIAESDP